MARCKVCHKQEQQKTRDTNRTLYNQQGVNRRYQKKLQAIEALGGKCVDCQGVFPARVYDFHHLNPKDKEGTPGNILGRSFTSIMKELDKCILLCANCHRLRHNERDVQ